jgi:flagellar basal-body rod modification protein FlgD
MPAVPGRPAQSFTWNGRGNNGVTWPDGSYTISISATGANGQPVGVSTQVQGVVGVSAVDVSQTPPQLTVGGQKVPISRIQSSSR